MQINNEKLWLGVWFSEQFQSSFRAVSKENWMKIELWAYQSDDLSGFAFIIGDGLRQDNDAGLAFATPSRIRDIHLILGWIDVAERRDGSEPAEILNGRLDEVGPLGQIQDVHLSRIHETLAITWIHPHINE